MTETKMMADFTESELLGTLNVTQGKKIILFAKFDCYITVKIKNKCCVRI